MLGSVLIIVVGIVILMILGLPVGMCFGAGAFNLLALPLYILLGMTIGAAGMASRLADFATALTGRIKGGLGIAIIIANGVFGAMSGSSLSALGGMGKAFLPTMEKEGYPTEYAISILIPSAVLSCLIPPSGFLLVFGFLGQLSIARCFLAGIFPGLILMSLLITIHLVMSRKIPTITTPPKIGVGAQIKGLAKSAYRNSLTLLIPVVVLGVIYGGFGTPTESAGFGAVYAFILGFFVYRTIKPRHVPGVLVEAATVVGTIFILFFFFISLSRVLILERVSEQLLALMMSITINKWALLGMLNVLMLFMGMIMDDISTGVINAIILLPIAVNIGFNPYHWAAISVVNLELGLITPPVAPLLYLGGSLAGDMPLAKYIKPVLAFTLFGFVPTLLLTMFFPALGSFLPLAFNPAR